MSRPEPSMASPPRPASPKSNAVSRARGHAGGRAGGSSRGGSGGAGGGGETVWLFGLHAVRDALLNPARTRHRLILTRNAADRLADALPQAGLEPEIADARKFPAPLDPQSVHQGAALEASPLEWGTIEARCAPAAAGPAPIVVALDRVTDPHNVGAILRSAEVFGALAVIAPRRHSAPETGALAKTASGALERQPYLRIGNLGDGLLSLRKMGYRVLGLDDRAEETIGAVAERLRHEPVCLVLGAEGPGLRERSRSLCTDMAQIAPARAFASLNVSNAAAVALYSTLENRINI